MPFYLKAGFEPRNRNKLTSKGFFIKRVKTTITRKWGAVILSGHSYKKIHWEVSYPQIKTLKFKTIDEAKEFMRVSIQRRLSNGYKKIGSKIV